MSGSTPSLGVLITYHNEGTLLTDCLRSLQRQAAPPDEIIVFDDASALGAAAFIPADCQAQVIRAERNLGPAAGRNRLLGASRSEWVHFHDADDLFLPAWSERVRAVLEPGTDCVFTEVETVHENGEHHASVLGLTELISSADLLAFSLRHSLLTPAGTYRRTRLLELGGYNERLWQSEDFEFHVRLALHLKRWTALPESLVRVRVRAAGRSRRQIEVWRSAGQAVRELEEQVPRSHWPDLAACAQRVGNQLLQLRQYDAAREALRRAQSLGLQPADAARGVHRLARRLGLPAAYWLAALYRTLLPASLRRWLATLRI
jgi:glycosyltransferase involved in cell wall biosynthesis